MIFEMLETIANAVLFEGYILYPYRPSAIKNRHRWNFGTLYPHTFAEAKTPPERWSFSTQILMKADEGTTLSSRIRFLQLVSSSDGQDETWQEGFPRSRELSKMTIGELRNGIEQIFDLGNLSTDECNIAPPAFYEQPRIARLALSTEELRKGLYRLSATLSNESPVSEIQTSLRTVQDLAFTSAHLLLGIEKGTFLSLLEPPAEYKTEVAACVQDGVFPVLAGDAIDHSRLLCSPIILYDYPQVAPESTGDFFDSTEMDEMLALRVLTLTDEEKIEMRRSDPHARAILERTESLPNEQLLKVHGALRGLHPVIDNNVAPSTTVESDNAIADPFTERPPLESARVFGMELHKGDRVRLWPQKKADIMDKVMEGKIAIIEAIEQDLEDNIQFAVVLEDDPGRDMGMLRQAGHRFFFSPEEVEPLRLEIS